jgi:hypothetical protein
MIKLKYASKQNNYSLSVMTCTSELVVVVKHQMSNASAIAWRKQVTFDKMMMMSALYWNNSQNYIFFMVIAH